MMTTMEWKSDFIEGFVREGMEQGKEQVSSCTDIAQLDEWFDRALTADTASDIFKS